MRLHPDEPIGADVFGFDDKMKRCSDLEKSRKWYCHTHPYTVSADKQPKIEPSFDRYGDPEVDHMVAMWKLVRKEEAKLFAGLPKHFKVIPDPRLGPELMEAERYLNYDYIATMINEEHTGMRIEAAKKIMILLKHMDSWAMYAVDMEKKICLVMDPVETEERRHEVEAKHRRNAIRVLSNLRRCEREESWIYAMYYLREYTGEKPQSLTDNQIDYLGKSLAYQLVTMQENRAVLPWCMREPEEED